MVDPLLKADSHLHSIFSCDAISTIDEMCQTAIEQGLWAISFTEHVDWDASDGGLDFYRYEAHRQAIHQAREKYAGQLRILQGVEFSEPHAHPREFEQFMQHEFDFVLGSVHYVAGTWVGDTKALQSASLEQVYERYYREVLKAVQFGGFDCLAHIDFPKRYLGAKSEPVGILEEITRELVKRGIALEINSSSVRRGHAELHPSDTILELYVKNGGRHVTSGSDAHKREQIGSYFNLIHEKITRFKLQPVIFCQRQAMEIERSLK